MAAVLEVEGPAVRRAPHDGRSSDAALTATLQAGTWRERQASLALALGEILNVQSTRGLPTRPAATVPFYDRPYLHPDEQIIDNLLSTVINPSLREHRVRGSIEQQTDNVALLVDPSARRAATARD